VNARKDYLFKVTVCRKQHTDSQNYGLTSDCLLTQIHSHELNFKLLMCKTEPQNEHSLV